jgi:hypothetical protein
MQFILENIAVVLATVLVPVNCTTYKEHIFALYETVRGYILLHICRGFSALNLYNLLALLPSSHLPNRSDDYQKNKKKMAEG